MNWFLAEFDIPGEVFTVLVFLLLSLFSWLKTRFFDKPEEEPDWEDEEMREVIWRRQTGQEAAPPPLPERASPPPVPVPGTTIRFDRPIKPSAVPARVAVAPPAPPKPRELSDRELELADAFENLKTSGSRRRSRGHRGQIDCLLRSPSSAKNAILLTEILGQPLAMREETGK